MSKMVQIRYVPDLSDLIKRELERTAERPSVLEWLERTRQAKTIPAKRSARK